jgi:hypothetical protein
LIQLDVSNYKIDNNGNLSLNHDIILDSVNADVKINSTNLKQCVGWDSWYNFTKTFEIDGK